MTYQNIWTDCWFGKIVWGTPDYSGETGEELKKSVRVVVSLRGLGQKKRNRRKLRLKLSTTHLSVSLRRYIQLVRVQKKLPSAHEN